MTFIVISTARDYEIYCPQIFGMETWGTNHQTSIIKKKKHWYYSSWSAGNEFYADEYEETKLNVLLETKDIDEVIEFFPAKKRKYAINQLEKIMKDYFAFERWILE